MKIRTAKIYKIIAKMVFSIATIGFFLSSFSLFVEYQKSSYYFFATLSLIFSLLLMIYCNVLTNYLSRTIEDPMSNLPEVYLSEWRDRSFERIRVIAHIGFGSGKSRWLASYEDDKNGKSLFILCINENLTVGGNRLINEIKYTQNFPVFIFQKHNNVQGITGTVIYWDVIDPTTEYKVVDDSPTMTIPPTQSINDGNKIVAVDAGDIIRAGESNSVKA